MYKKISIFIYSSLICQKAIITIYILKKKLENPINT